MQLPFAIFPLMMITSDRKRMGEFANTTLVKFVGFALCLLIAGLNLFLLFEILGAFWMLAIVSVVVIFAGYVQFIYRAPDSGAT
jgi:manganese transport protein